MGTPLISIFEWNGNSVATDKTSSLVRFKAIDNAAVDAVNPLVVPGSGRTYSCEKWLRLHIGTGDPAQQLANLRFYTDGSNGYGANIALFGEISASDTFRSAALANTSNTIPLGGSGSRTMTSIFGYTSGGALSLSSAAQTFSGSNTDIGRFVVMVMRVLPGATTGTLTPESLSFNYDSSAVATASNMALNVSFDGTLAGTHTNSLGFDALMGEASADGPFSMIAGVETEITNFELLSNDFDVLDHDPDNGDSIFIVSVTDFVNGSASSTGTTIKFLPTASGTAAFHYIGSYNNSLSTGSVAITVSDFDNVALLLPLYTLTNFEQITEGRTGQARATGIDINRQIVSYSSGQERFTIDLLTGAALGLVVENTGENRLSNSALSASQSGWLSIIDGTRSATASILGADDGCFAIDMKAASVTLGGPGGRPFLAQTRTDFSCSETFIASMIVEYFTGAASGVIIGQAGFGSATGMLAITASQIVSATLPYKISMAFTNIQSATDKTTGTIRYGLGISTSTSATMVFSRPLLEKKKGRLTFTPDAVRNPDMPTVAINHATGSATFPFATAAGSFVIQAKTALALEKTGIQMLVQVDDGAGNATNCHQFFRSNTGNIIYKIITSGVNQCRLDGGFMSADTTFRLEASYASNDVRLSVNGDPSLTTVAATMPLGLTTLRLGHDFGPADWWNGTIAEMNVFRVPSDDASVPSASSSTSSSASGGTGGGGGSNPGNTTPSSYYGAGHQAVSLYNSNQMKLAGGQYAQSFLAERNGVITGIKFYAIFHAPPSAKDDNYANYSGISKPSGYVTNGIPGGKIRVRIYKNGTGNVPSTIVPGLSGDSGGGSFRVIENAYSELYQSGIISFPEVSGSCAISSSVIYHLVWDNPHSDPPNNYCEIDAIKPTGVDLTHPERVPHNPSVADIYDKVQFRKTAVSTWTHYNQTPMYQIRYAGNSWFQGRGYMEAPLYSGDEGYVPVGGSTQVRQIMMPYETMTLSQINLVVKSGTIPTGNLIATTRQQSNGAVLDTTTIAPTLISSGNWLKNPVNLRSSPMILSASKTYTVTFANAGGGSWGIGGIRDGSISLTHGGPSGDFHPLTTVKGRAEKTTNGGSSWVGFENNNATDTDVVDLMWYYTRT